MYSIISSIPHDRMRQNVSIVWVLTLSFRLSRVSWPGLMHAISLQSEAASRNFFLHALGVSWYNIRWSGMLRSKAEGILL